MSITYICEWCHKKFKFKRGLIDHLRGELEDAELYGDMIIHQLYDLGVKDPYLEE